MNLLYSIVPGEALGQLVLFDEIQWKVISRPLAVGRGAQKIKKFEIELADKLFWLWKAIVVCTKNFRSLAFLEHLPQAAQDYTIMTHMVENDKTKKWA